VSESMHHGGRLNQAAREWGIPRSRWLDLSTGINPAPWPVPPLPPEVWQRLPEDDDGLPNIVRQWAGAPASAAVLPLPGSQAAIQALPRLRPPCRVGVPRPGYAEHAHRWRQAGHQVRALDTRSLDQALDQLDVVVWVQPNNPTGETLAPEQLQRWHRNLAERGGWLVIDEAFLPGHASASLSSLAGAPGLVILRSLGKFFGLAGVRAGAILAWPELADCMAERIGPWSVSAPARFIMARALADRSWQQEAAGRLAESGARLDALLRDFRLPPEGGTALFRYLRHPRARAIADHLARQAVLVRVFEDPAALRFGLPGDEAQWQHLERGLVGLPD